MSGKSSFALDQIEKGEGSSAETTRRDSDRSKNGKENDKDDDEDKIDKGPSILSVDQSAITGESLAVDKCNFHPFYFYLRAENVDT